MPLDVAMEGDVGGGCQMWSGLDDDNGGGGGDGGDGGGSGGVEGNTSTKKKGKGKGKKKGKKGKKGRGGNSGGESKGEGEAAGVAGAAGGTATAAAAAVAAGSPPFTWEDSVRGCVCAGKDEQRRDLELAFQLATKAMESEDIAEEYEHGKESLRLRRKWLHPLNVHLLSTFSSFLTVAMVAGEWIAAIECCTSMIDIYEWYYPDTHPLLGLQLYTKGNLLSNIGKYEEAMPVLDRALTILTLSFGAENGMVQGLRSLIDVAKEGTTSGSHARAMEEADPYASFVPGL